MRGRRAPRLAAPAALAVLARAARAATGAPASAPAAPPGPRGKVSEHRIPSKLLGRERRVWVYAAPPCAAAAGARCDLLVVFDGQEYLEDIGLPAMLDSLLERRETGPLVAVLVDNATGTERLDDLANRSAFADFVAGELVPWVTERFGATLDPHRTFATGSSAGGLAAAYLALRRPERVGNVLSQSGAFWRGNEASNDPPYEWLTRQVESSPRKDVRFLLEVGGRESAGALGGAAPSILEANRRLRDALREKGYAVAYAEPPDGFHAPEFWKLRLPAAIAALAGSAAK